jgi:hypothetical protein
MKVTSRKVDALTATHKIRREERAIIMEPRMSENVTCKYVCLSCTKKFTLDLRPSDSPYCPWCKGVEVKALTPAASFINDRGRVITDKHKIKLLKFIKKGWENLNEFKAYGTGLVQTAQRIGVPERVVTRIEKAVNAAVDALDRKHAKIMKQYQKGGKA